MNTLRTRVLLPAAMLSLTCLSMGRADDGQNLPPLDTEHQARLLERFGDDGIDGDGDGVLTHEEARAFFQERFGEMDIDARGGPGFGRHDGRRGPGERMRRLGKVLHHLEMLESGTPPAQFTIERHPEADVDADGVVSDEEWLMFASERRAEILTRLVKRFPGADADGDGTLNAEELELVKADIRARVLNRHPEADTDGDGILSEEEAKAFHEARLEEHKAQLLERHPEADVDGDGKLSDDEFHRFLGDRPGRGGRFGGHGKGHGGMGFGDKGRSGEGFGDKGRGGCGRRP